MVQRVISTDNTHEPGGECYLIAQEVESAEYRGGVTIRGLLYAKEMTFRERMARLQSSKPHQRRGAGGLGE